MLVVGKIDAGIPNRTLARACKPLAKHGEAPTWILERGAWHWRIMKGEKYDLDDDLKEELSKEHGIGQLFEAKNIKVPRVKAVENDRPDES